MPAEIEIAAEAADRASRRWENAAHLWRAAGQRALEASLAAAAWAPRLPDTAYRFAEAYHECVRGLRGHLLTGAQALESAAGGLRATAREYLEVDAESARALQALVERAGPADAR